MRDAPYCASSVQPEVMEPQTTPASVSPDDAPSVRLKGRADDFEGIEMAKEKTTDIVLGSRECGCICAVVALGITTQSEDRKSIAELVGMGLIAKRVTNEQYRAMLPFRTCPDCAERRKAKRTELFA